MGSLYSVGYSGSSGAAGNTGFSGLSGTIIPTVSNLRLTLESGIPISSSNQEAKTTLYLTPYLGKQISLYYNSIWKTYTSSEVSISLSGKTANKNNDVFAYYTGSAVALELVEWTNDSTRATSLGRQDGVIIKTGDSTKRYIGTIRTTGTTGQCEDSFTSRYVWNMYNQVKRFGFTCNTNSSWTYSSAAWREWNNGSGQYRFKFVFGQPQVLEFNLFSDTSATSTYVGSAIDTTSNNNSYVYIATNSYMTQSVQLYSYNYQLLTAGYHYFTGVEYVTSGTMTGYGYGSSTSAGYGHHTIFVG